jgi:hypothetical protein
VVSEGEAHLGRQGPRLVELMKQGQVVTIENAGRDLVEFEPERIAAVIRGYVGGSPTPPRTTP